MSNSQARPKRSLIDIIKDQGIKERKLAGDNRINFSGVSASSSPLGGTSGKSILQNIRPQDAFLKTAGDTMIGPIAFFPVAVTISSGALDISKATTSKFSSYVIVSGEGAVDDTLATITGAEHAGQVLYLQPILTNQITLTETGGNLILPGGNDVVANSAKDGRTILKFIFDVTVNANKWTLASNSEGVTAVTAGTHISASLSADQTTNLLANDHVEFDTKDRDGGIVLQTGAGQADGIFELKQGRTYILSAQIRPEFSGATGVLEIAWFNITGAVEIGKRGVYQPTTQTSDDANQPIPEIIFKPTVDSNVELRIISVTALTAIANEYSIATIHEFGGGGGGGVTFPLIPDINARGNVTGTVTVDLSLSNAHYQEMTLTGNITFVFSNPPVDNKEISFILDISQDVTGGRTVIFPASVRVDPVVGSGANARTVIVVSTVDNGTNFDALIVTGGTTAFPNEFVDNVFRIKDDIDDSRKLAFQVGGIAASTTRTLTVQNASGTIPLLDGSAGAQIFSNAIQMNAILDMDGNDLVLDADADSKFVTSVDDVLTLNLLGSAHFIWNTIRFDIAAKDLQLSEIANPGAPGATSGRIFLDSLDNTLKVRKSSGTVTLEGGNPPFDDNQDIIQDDVDNTKKLRFSLASFATGTTSIIGSNTLTAGRTWSFPDASGVVDLISLAQTISGIKTHSADILGSGSPNLGGVGSEFVSLFLSGKVNFNSTTTDFIQGDAGGLNFKVATGKGFDFQVNLISAVEINSSRNLNLKNHNIIDLNDILFNIAGQTLISDTSGLHLTTTAPDFIDFAPGSTLNIKMDDFFLLLTNTADQDTQIVLHNNRAIPVNGALVDRIFFDGEDSAGNQQSYASIEARSELVTSGSEEGELHLRVATGSVGALEDGLVLEGGTGTFGSIKIGFRGAVPASLQTYTVTNRLTDRSYDANATSIAELADVLGTLLKDLSDMGIVTGVT